MDETIRLDDLRALVAIVDAGSFTAAAQRLGVPKQTLSRRLAVLEERLGVRLLQRTTRRTRPTELGTALAARARSAIGTLEDAVALVGDRSREVRGTLRLTADPLFGEVFLPGLLAELVAAHPALQLDLVLTNRRVDLVEEGFDAAFRVGPQPSSSLIATQLGPASMAYVASAAYLDARGTPATPDALDGHDLIALAPEDGGRPRWAFAEDEELTWRPIRPRLRVNHLPTARRFARDGHGIANLPAFAVENDLASGALRSVLADRTAAFGRIAVVYPSARLLAPRVRALVDLAVRRLRPPAV